jgi:hypothetical protein
MPVDFLRTSTSAVAIPCSLILDVKGEQGAPPAYKTCRPCRHGLGWLMKKRYSPPWLLAELSTSMRGLPLKDRVGQSKGEDM